MLNEKLNNLIKTKVSDLHERGDFWHPDPAQDRKLGGPGANQRAREDREAASQPKEDPKKLRPGESYSEYAKRQGGSTVTKPAAKSSLTDRLKNKLGKAIDKIGGINSSYEPDGEVLESAVPGKPAERLGAVTAIPQSERDAARERLLAKTKEIRNKKGLKEAAPPGDKYERMVKHIKKNYPKNRQGIAFATAWKQYNKVHNKEFEIKEGKNESLSFSDFMEARRMDKEGVDRNDTARKNRTMAAKASVAAVQKRQAVLDKYEKKTGTKLDISRSKEGKEHARNFPGSRQQPKERGAKETPLETHNRRVSRSNARVIKHGFTKKEKEANRGMYSSRFD